MGFKVETWISDCPYWVQWTFHPHWKPSHRKDKILQCHRYYSRTSCWLLECQHQVWQSQPHPANLPQYNLLIHLCNITLHFTLFIPLYHQWLSSALQPSTHIHPYHKLISDGAWRIGNFSTSFSSIPHQAFLDHHCPCITRKFGAPLEAFQQATHQNATISQILGTIPISTYTATYYTPVRIS